jgi:hypothetical protein
MAARASFTEARRARHDRPGVPPRRWVPAALGMTWGHACLVAAGYSLAPAATVSGTPDVLPWVRLLEWTLMLPLTLSMVMVHRTSAPLETLTSEGIPLQALALPALAGWSLAVVGARLWRHRRGVPVRVILAASLMASGLSGVSAARAIADERTAERIFMRMVAADSAPWEEPASRSAARMLVTRYPDSRWASEGWRVVATDAELREDLPEALGAWRSFEACFDPAAAAGRAFGALNTARILESIAPADVVAAHYLRALRTIERGNGTAQSWIAPESARGLAKAARRDGLHATAEYWAARASVHEGHCWITERGGAR